MVLALSGLTYWGGDGGGLSTTLSPGLKCGAWCPSLDGDLDLLIGEWWVGLACA